MTAANVFISVEKFMAVVCEVHLNRLNLDDIFNIIYSYTKALLTMSMKKKIKPTENVQYFTLS